MRALQRKTPRRRWRWQLSTTKPTLIPRRLRNKSLHNLPPGSCAAGRRRFNFAFRTASPRCPVSVKRQAGPQRSIPFLRQPGFLSFMGETRSFPLTPYNVIGFSGTQLVRALSPVSPPGLRDPFPNQRSSPRFRVFQRFRGGDPLQLSVYVHRTCWVSTYARSSVVTVVFSGKADRVTPKTINAFSKADQGRHPCPFQVSASGTASVPPHFLSLNTRATSLQHKFLHKHGQLIRATLAHGHAYGLP